MVSDKLNFQRSGPYHITRVDWNNAHHRRSVLASLVQGVSVLERDRQKHRQGPRAFATPWWDFFHFELHERLVDTHDKSIIGAVYRYKLFDLDNNSTYIPPQYVIAFRGTILSLKTHDLFYDLKLITSGLQNTSRFEEVMSFIAHFVSTTNGGKNVWLAGYSLGSSMALKVGKNLAKKSIFLETHLFNPPFPSPSLGSIKNKNVKHGMKCIFSVGKAIAATALKIEQQGNSSKETLRVLQGWIPNLYVHPEDLICAAYIDYFEHREYMEEKGAVMGHIENIAAQYSTVGLIKNAIGKDHESLHRIPSATLTVNAYKAAKKGKAHKLRLWWSLDINLRSTTYKYEDKSRASDLLLSRCP